MPYLVTFSNYTNNDLREKIKARIKASGDGAKPGQWSAIKSMRLAKEYKAAGGGYQNNAPKSKPQKNLVKWQSEKWRTKSGKPSRETGERFLPKKAIDAMSPQMYAASTRAKRAGTKAGKQHVPQSSNAVKIANRYR
jgi:hypothetical protein